MEIVNYYILEYILFNSCFKTNLFKALSRGTTFSSSSSTSSVEWSRILVGTNWNPGWTVKTNNQKIGCEIFSAKKKHLGEICLSLMTNCLKKLQRKRRKNSQLTSLKIFPNTKKYKNRYISTNRTWSTRIELILYTVNNF